VIEVTLGRGAANPSLSGLAGAETDFSNGGRGFGYSLIGGSNFSALGWSSLSCFLIELLKKESSGFS
jgi:hypothetical protein